MKAFEIHKLTSEKRKKEAFKICSVQFDEPCELEEPIQAQKYNIIWVKEGHGKYIIDFKSYEIHDQMMFFLKPGQMYQVISEMIVEGTRMSFEQDFYCVDIMDSPTSCNGILFNDAYQTPLSLNDPQSDELHDIVRLINQEFARPGVAHREMIHTYLQLFMIKATRIKTQQNGFCVLGEQSDQDSAFVQSFHDLLDQHYTEKHAVSDYAELLFMSPKALHKKMKRITGHSVSSIIHDRLVLAAKRKLYHSDHSIKEIGYELGFEDSGYFTRFFTKYAHESPSEFREKMKVF